MKSFFPVLVLWMITQLPAVNQESNVFGHEPIHAKVGDDVILPCHLDPPFDVNNLTIEWKFQGQIIHLHRSRATNDETPDPKYKNRTSMFHDEFKDGNISLRLIKVTKEDEGNYICFVPKLESQVRKGKVTLKLDENGAQGNSTDPRGGNGDNNNGTHNNKLGLGLGLGIPAIIIIIIIISVRYWRRRQNGIENGNPPADDGVL